MAARSIFRDRCLPLRAKGGRRRKVFARDWTSGSGSECGSIGKSVERVRPDAWLRGKRRGDT